MYYYLITSRNEKYTKFNQVGLNSLNGNNEVVLNIDQNFALMAKEFSACVKLGICIECIFYGTNVSD